jgi:hypothetical protein
MKNLIHSTLCLFALISLVAIHSCKNLAEPASEVIIYPAPEKEQLSEDYTLEVNGKPVDIYLAKIAEVDDLQNWMLQPEEVGGPYSFTYFDFSGDITIKITSLKKSLDQLVIRPLSSGVVPEINGNTATFTISEPCKLSFEPDGRIEPLLIFANAPEIDPPAEGDENVLYFGPGVHKPEKISLSSGQTLYIAGGAIVKAGVAVSGENINIKGRGILCGNDWQWRQGPGRMLGINESSNVVIDDIILRGAWSWTIPIYNSDSITITNIKLVGSKNPNDDGINPCNSQKVYIRDCFIRSDDDCIAMKGMRLGSENDNVEDIVVENCLLWADRARVFLLGHESRAQYMRNIVLRNIDILHFNMTPFLIEPGEEMSIENVIVEDITAYADFPAQGGAREFNLICLRPTVNQYMHNKVPGKISNMEFKNISLTGEEREGKYPVLVAGADPEHQVTDITFENITWFGHKLNEDAPQVIIGDHTENIRFNN